MKPGALKPEAPESSRVSGCELHQGIQLGCGRAGIDGLRCQRQRIRQVLGFAGCDQRSSSVQQDDVPAGGFLSRREFHG